MIANRDPESLSQMGRSLSSKFLIWGYAFAQYGMPNKAAIILRRDHIGARTVSSISTQQIASHSQATPGLY